MPMPPSPVATAESMAVDAGTAGLKSPTTGERNFANALPHPSTDDRENRQHDQRDGHDRGRLVKVMETAWLDSRLAEERHEDEPEHVEAGDARRDRAQKPEPEMA